MAPARAGSPFSIETRIDNPGFRASGITAYLKNGGMLEKPAATVNHAGTRAMQLSAGAATNQP